jgi:ribosome-binding factor A
LALLAFVEYGVNRKREVSRLVCYERIELIRPENRERLIADLEHRLGHKVNRVEIGNVDFLRDIAFIKVYYTPAKGESATMDSTLKINEKNAFNN